jgi:hypothetical protein
LKVLIKEGRYKKENLERKKEEHAGKSDDDT